MKRTRPTQADVARLAGVSQSTVSMVLNQRDGGAILISEETVAKVQAAMRELGYAPDPAAQRLAQGRNRLIAVFNYDPAASYIGDGAYHRILVGIETGADQNDHNILLLTRNRTAEQRSIFHGGVNTLRLADGAILMGIYPNHDELRQLVDEGYPFVYIGRRDVPNVDFDWVISDYHSAGYQATQHLLRRGHRRFGYVCQKVLFGVHSSQERWNGCQTALRGVDTAELVLIDVAEISYIERLRATLHDLDVTALICNDVSDFRTLTQALLQAGLRVPDDISVVVLGDTLGELAASTHVRMHRERVGEAAVNLLVQRIDAVGIPPVQHVLVPCELVLGDTTGECGAGRSSS